MYNNGGGINEEVVMIERVISGGQTGADQAGLQAAQDAGIPTGGWIPKGFRTEVGSKPELKIFNLVETLSSGYLPRTYLNVQDSDGTIYFASNWTSSGTVATLQAVSKFSKPLMKVSLYSPLDVGEAVAWIERNNIVVLNVAGHRESVCPGTFDTTYNFISELIRRVNEQ